MLPIDDSCQASLSCLQVVVAVDHAAWPGCQWSCRECKYTDRQRRCGSHVACIYLYRLAGLLMVVGLTDVPRCHRCLAASSQLQLQLEASTMSSTALKDMSLSSLQRALSNPSSQRAIYAVLLTGALSSAILPSILPSRISFFGIPPLHDVFANILGSKDSRERVKRHGLEKWMESEREYAWKRLLK